MKRRSSTLVAIAAALALGGCAGDIGAREIDRSPQRDYSADINASLHHGPTASKPGMIGTEEPLGAFPWDIGGSRQ